MLPDVSPTAPRLYVLAPSHFCERARWALDHAGIAFIEERWAVGTHALRARRIAPGSSLPILDTGSEVIQGSDAILDWCGIPDGDQDLERRFVNEIGPLVRRYRYAGLLNDPDSGVLDILLDGVDPAEATLARLAWPATRRMMVAGMSTQAEHLPDLDRRITEALAWFGVVLGERRYVVGEQFGRSDLTAASLLSPLARPEACPLYRRVRTSAAIEERLTEWSHTPALRWVDRVYADHRWGRSSAKASPA